MRSLRKLLPLAGLLCVVGAASLHAAPPASRPARSTASPSPGPVAIPDYGGRESGPIAVSESAPSPLAQMGRATEALVIVLAGVVGIVYALKRFGLVTPGANGKPARIALTGPGLTGRGRKASSPGDAPVTILSSQTLPGGAMLHVVSVAGRNLLLGATPQSVSALSEWAAVPETVEEAAAFEDYLSRADTMPGGGIAAANARLQSLLGRPPSEENS